MNIENTFFDTTDFELQETKLGEGTFGIVYVAKNIKDNKLYAIKIIKTHGNFNGHDQMLLMRESLILSRLKHPGIVEFKGVNFQSFDDPNKLEPSIITEYIQRGSLKTILDQEKKSLADAAWSSTKKYILLLGITNAMKYLHNHGIIHRDLKPENILVDENHYPHICDFGLSRCFSKSLTKTEDLTMTGQIGTPMYMAPELFTIKNHYSSTVDVYSFSMIAYEIVTGKVPFSEHGDTITSVTLGIIVASGYRPKIPEFIPEKMQNLISRCWNEDQSQRPSFDEIFNELSSDFTYLGEDVDEDEINEYLLILEDKNNEHSFDDLYEVNAKLLGQIDELKKLSSLNEYNNNKQISELIESNKKLHENLEEVKNKFLSYTSSNQTLIDSLHYLLGSFRDRNIKKAIQELQKSSEKENSCSSYILGLLYANSTFVEGDFEKAKLFFKRSSEQGNSAGFFEIA